MGDSASLSEYMEQRAARGRPSMYSFELAADILERLSNGETLASICRDVGMPATRTVHKWKDAHPEFRAEFERARVAGIDAMAADCLEISDETGNDTKFVPDRGGGEREVPNGEVISRSDLRIKTRLKLMACWHPAKYGNKVQVGGMDDAPPIKTEGTIHIDAAALREAAKTVVDEC